MLPVLSPFRSAVRISLVSVVLLAPLLAQEPRPKEIQEFEKRAKVEPYEQDGVTRVKVTVDDTVLYDRPGKGARVKVEKSARLAGPLFISVRVEGEEVARYWVRSLAKPVKFPPTLIRDPNGVSLSSTAQALNEKSYCKIDLGASTVYEGPGSAIEPQVVGKRPRQWYSIRVDDEIVYYVPAGVEARVKKEDPSLPAAAAQKQPEPAAPSPPAAEEPLKESVAKVLKRLNEIRVAAGLPAVKEDPKLSAGCQLHAEYLRQNPKEEGPRAHSEDPNLPGYTEEGKKSAARSVISRTSERRNPTREVERLIATLYHRLSMVHPHLASVGVGIALYDKEGIVVVIDTDTIDAKIAESVRPVLYPYDGQHDVHLMFSLGGGEYPDPRPIKVAVGYPVTLSCSEFGWTPGEASAFLSAKGNEVPSWVFCRENEALDEFRAPGTVCILPKKPLSPNTTYTVTVKCKKYGISGTPDWSKTWSFTTGKGDDEPKK